MDNHQVDPRNIGIELTESIFTSDYAAVNRTIEKLKAHGVTIAIDDFGTGYSSLSREKELNVDCLKIDKSFIDQLMETEPGKAITGDIISMAHRLGHCAVAEGVEVEAQKQYLIDHGCDRMQGFLFSKALDEEDALALLKKHRT
jgi:sensor c-di-GMP phosphodiesterase-like protein